MVARLRAAGNRVYLAVALVALIVLVATAPPQKPSTNSFTNGMAVAKWMVGYYRQPEPHRAADAMTVLSVEGGLQAEHRFMTIAAFLAGVIDGDARVAGDLVAHAANAGADQQRLLAQAVVLSRRRDEVLATVTAKLPRAQEAIARLAADRATADTLRNPIGGSTAALDFYWAYFMATGKDEAVAAVIAAVAGTLQDGDLQGMMAGHAAKWLLAANAGQHPALMQACRKAAAETGPLAEALKDVVAAAEAGDAPRIRREWRVAIRDWKARQERAPELSATSARGGA